MRAGLDRHAIAKEGARFRGDALGRIQEHPDRAVGAQQREGQRQRRMREVGATDVQQPGDGMRVGQDRGLLTGLPEFGSGSLALQLGGGTSIFQRMRQHRGRGRRRAVAPDGVDRIGAEGDELHAGEALQRGLAVQPGIVTDAPPFGILPQPAFGWLLRDVAPLEQVAIRLGLDLGGVTAIG
jgi:hypothetical protein